MKAPDKVYVSIGPRQSLIARAGQTLKSDIEYISKGALLDWLKECKENPVITDLQKGNIQEMIEKIESL